MYPSNRSWPISSCPQVLTEEDSRWISMKRAGGSCNRRDRNDVPDSVGSLSLLPTRFTGRQKN